MELVDTKTGTVATIPDEHAEAAVRSGKYTFAAGSKVAVRNDAGKLGRLDAEAAMSALARGSVSLATEGELHHAKVEKEYGGVGGTLAATGEGAARGLTMGLSDPAAIEAARALGGDESAEHVREHLEGGKEASPWASGTAELAGAAAPLLLSGGAAAPLEAGEAAEGASALVRGVRAAGALPRATAGIGHAIERGGAALLGEGAESLGGRLAQAVLPKAAAGAAEGAAYGAGSAISEHALNGGDHELTAEQLLAAAGHGAIFGSALAGGLGAGGELASSAIGGLTDLASEKLAASGGIRGFLEEQADKQGWRSLSPAKKFTEQAEARAGGVAAVGRTLRDEGIFEASSLREAARAPSDLLPRVTEAKERIGAELGDVMTKSGATIPAADIFRPIQDIIDREGAKAGFGHIASSLEEYRNDLADKLGIIDSTEQVPVQELFKQRRALDELVYKEGGPMNPTARVELLREIRRGLADTEMRAVDEATTATGVGRTYEELKDLRKRYQHLSLAEDALEKTTAAYSTNRNISLSGQLAGVGLMASGHGLLAIPGAIAHQVVKERGNAIAATFLGRLSQLGMVEAASRDIDAQMTSAIRGYLSRTAESVGHAAVPVSMRVAMGRSERGLRASYDRRVEQIRAQAQGPDLQKHLADRIGALATHAPNTAAQLTAKATTAAAFLASQVPKSTPPTSLLQPLLKGPPPSDAAMARFLRIDAVVQRPLAILSEMRAGRLTKDQVDAARTVYPKLLQRIQQSAVEHLAHRKAPLPYSKRKGLTALLGVPADATMSPDFVREMQASYAGTPVEPKQASGKAHHGHAGGHGKPGIAQRGMTDLDVAEASGDTAA